MNRRQILQSLMALPAVKSVEVASVSARDVIVVECDVRLSEIQRERIHAAMKQVWPDNKAVVLDGGLRLKVAREAAAT